MSNRTVVIGAGPAGLAAAYQLKRRGLPYRVLEKSTESNTVVLDSAEYWGRFGNFPNLLCFLGMWLQQRFSLFNQLVGLIHVPLGLFQQPERFAVIWW